MDNVFVLPWKHAFFERFIFFCLSCREQKRQRDLPPVLSLPKPDRSFVRFSHRNGGAEGLEHPLLLSQAIRRELTGSETAGSQTGSHMGYRCCRHRSRLLATVPVPAHFKWYYWLCISTIPSCRHYAWNVLMSISDSTNVNNGWLLLMFLLDAKHCAGNSHTFSHLIESTLKYSYSADRENKVQKKVK